MKAMKDKFIVKTEDKERIKVEGELLERQPYFPKSTSKTKQPSLRELFVKFNQEQTKFNQEQREFNKNINTRLDKVDSRLDNIDTRLDNVEQDIKLIKNTPTIKKELSFNK